MKRRSKISLVKMVATRRLKKEIASAESAGYFRGQRDATARCEEEIKALQEKLKAKADYNALQLTSPPVLEYLTMLCNANSQLGEATARAMIAALEAGRMEKK